MTEESFDRIDKNAHRIAYLIAGYIRNSLTEAEHDELDSWVNEHEHNMELFEDLTDEKNIEATLIRAEELRSKEKFQELKTAGSFEPTLTLTRKTLLAAASIVFLLGTFAIYRFWPKAGGQIPTNVVVATNLEPGNNKATLRLSNGKSIDLTAQSNGAAIPETNAQAYLEENGKLVYKSDSTAQQYAGQNTLNTPIGGQFQVVLSDGTKVWLNAASSLTYPVQFSANERKVQVRGEAYFEVNKDPRRPFKVQFSDTSSLTVLGTHFNLNAYPDDSAQEVTLLEGRVSVTDGRVTKMLEPSTKANISDQGLKKISDVDTEEIIGWKNGAFIFKDASIESIMKQIARWYGAQIQYEGKINSQFNASVARNEPLSKLLHLLELNGYVHFKIQNQTIYVYP